MPALLGLVGGLKPSQNSKASKKAWKMPFLGNFVVNLLFIYGR